jgi:hypothetical protein
VTLANGTHFEAAEHCAKLKAGLPELTSQDDVDIFNSTIMPNDTNNEYYWLASSRL